MHLKKIKVYHFNNGGGGGVLSVTKNLLRYTTNPLIENHVIYTINKDLVSDFKVKHIKGAESETVFYYSPRWNFYHTCKKLSKLVPDKSAVIVANDWLELAMASNLGLPNKIIQVVHGDYEYYYSLAIMHSAAIDAYITVASTIKEKLIQLLPDKNKTVECLYFPVPESVCVDEKKEENSIIFIGRCTAEKGYPLLPAIAASLSAKNIKLKWHIAGEQAEALTNLWPEDTGVVFHGLLPNDEVNKLLCRMQYFILPSLKEGMPVSLIESMKAGVIPIMNTLPGGVQEMITNGVTGYLSPNNTVEEYVQIIEALTKNKNQQSIRLQCRTIANDMFNPVINTMQYENFFEKVATATMQVKHATKIYGSRLDKKWIPNLLTRSIRSLQ